MTEQMIGFQSDYMEGAHPHVMARLLETNTEQTTGYSEDDYCKAAAARIRELCGDQKLAVHFLVGGTQTNTTVIASVLRPYQGVLCPSSGHIAVHETGAIEATGHKVLPLANRNGKITATQVERACVAHYADESFEHLVQPGMVCIALPTEGGTIYTKAELEAIYKACRTYGLFFYIDGARLPYALTAEGCDITLADLPKLCDAFYLGGTKCGTLFGEAVVFCGEAGRRDFRYMIKQRGGMLAKGRLLGIQFEAILQDDLYLELARHANEQAMRIRDAFAAKGVKFLFDSPTNQQFPILTEEQLKVLGENFGFTRWKRMDAVSTAVRFATCWATEDAAVDALVECIANLED